MYIISLCNTLSHISTIFTNKMCIFIEQNIKAKQVDDYWNV